MLEKLFKGFKNLKKEKITINRSDKQQDITGLSPKQIKTILMQDDLNTLLPLYHLMLERDLHLASEINKRKISLISLPYIISCSDDTIKDFINEWLDNINIHSLLSELSSSLAYGFCAIDIVWGSTTINNNSYFTPVSFSSFNQRFIHCDNNIDTLKSPLDYLFIKQDGNELFFKDMDSRKLLTHFHKIDTGNITDYAILKKVAWFIALKHLVISHNINYYDNLAVPPLIIKTDKSDDDEALQEIMTQALSLRSNSVGIFGKDDLVELLSAKSSPANFLEFIDKIDTQISIFINGNTLSSDSKKSGSYALGKVHQDIGEVYNKFDGILLSNTLNEFIKQVVAMNFPNPPAVKFLLQKEQNKDLKTLSEIYKNIDSMGYKIPIKHIEETFNIQNMELHDKKEIKENNKTTKEVNKKTFSKNMDHIDDELEKLDPNLNSISKDINKHLISILNQANSYDEALEIIVNNYKGDNLKKLESKLSQVILNSELIGLSDD